MPRPAADQPPPASLPARAFAAVVVFLRPLLVAGWIAAAVGAFLWLPGLPQEQGGSLSSLVVKDSPAIRAERRATDVFGLPLTSDTLVVQRDASGLSLQQQAAVVHRALKLDRRGYRDLLSIRFAVPIINTLGLFPASTERSTTAITYLYFEPQYGFGTTDRLAREFVERHLPPGAAAVGTTGAAPARLTQYNAITDAILWVTGATALLIALLVGLNFRAPLAPLVVLSAGAVGWAVDIHGLGWLSRRIGVTIPQEIEPLLVVLLLGIMTDYSIFYLSAQRTRLLAGDRPARAARSSAATLAPTIVTAGLTVAAGTAATLVARVGFVRAFGPGLALTALAGLVVASTFIPAALALLGRAVFWPSLGRRQVFVKDEDADEEPHRRSLRERAAYWATAKPLALVIALACIAALGAAASGLAGLKLGFGLISGLPTNSQAERAARAAGKGFAPGVLGITEVDVEQPGIGSRRTKLVALQRLLEREPGVAGVIGPRDQPLGRLRNAVLARSGDAARFGIAFSSDPYEPAAIAHLRDLQQDLPTLLRRAGLSGAHAAATGATAIASDTIRDVMGDLWRIGLVALGIAFALLAVFLRSLVAPFYLLFASVLAFAATLGLTVYVFQGLLGWPGITYYVPFATAVLLISLGSDYNVFVTGRIWEEGKVRPLRQAIAVATPRAARAITVAGIVLAGSFALLAIVPIRAFAEFAFTMAVGVLIDTFLVRSFLVPAFVSLFGTFGSWPGRRLRPPKELGAEA